MVDIPLMGVDLPGDRLLAVIKTQNEIAATALDLDAVLAIVVERARVLTRAAAAVVELVDGDEMVYHVGAGTAAAHAGLRLALGSSLSGQCVRARAILHCTDAATDDRVDFEPCLKVGAVSMVCVPLIHRDDVVGVLKVYDSRPNAFDDADVATLDLLSGVIAAHMTHASEFEEQFHDSRHDPLTGLPNRRAFDERLGNELARVSRYGGELAVCVLDLDGFKQVNDSAGHAAGDAVLRAVAVNVAALRDSDAAYRVGGDEFALLLVECSSSTAEAVASRIAAAIDRDPDSRGVSASWGVAAFEPGDDASSLVRRADEALYRDKRQAVA